MEDGKPRARAYALENRVQHYAWGSKDAIPALLGVANAEGMPWAELWMGAHPQAPSLAVPERTALGELLGGDPGYFLGPGIFSLPFLLKLLSAASPLSIQAHPSREQAERGYDREEAAGIPRDSADRLYRDRNHKPEIIAALGPYEALCGFRRNGDIARALSILSGEDEALDALIARAPSRDGDAGELRDFFSAHLAVSAHERRSLVDGARSGARRFLESSGAPADSSGLRAPFEILLRLSASYPEDPGILSALYLNVLRLGRLDALYIPHGVLHAYIEGTGVELMANSDNVLRGGLSPKKTDPAELERILRFEPYAPEILNPLPALPSGWKAYATPCPDFSLAVAESETRREGERPEIIFCAEGSFTLAFVDAAFPLARGGSLFIPAISGPYALSGSGLAFRASTGS